MTGGGRRAAGDELPTTDDRRRTTGPRLRCLRSEPAVFARRPGFTLWEPTMVLLILAVTATLAAPAIARLGEDQPATSADRVLALLHDGRKVALENHTTVILR